MATKVNAPSSPAVLIFDIETSPLIAHVWGLWENNVALNQLVSDWNVMSWSAKWLNDKPEKIMYMDQRNFKNMSGEKKILKRIWQLLDSADIVITQNGRHFDNRRLNSKFLEHGMQPPSSFKHIDTKVIAKKYFDFPSYKLEYMTEKLCKKYKKLKHKKFPGHEMWVECLKGNLEAWKEMEIYNKHDVLALEELYTKLIAWDSSINFNLYHDGEENVCKCGSKTFIKNGFYYTPTAKYQRHKCKACGAEVRDRQNLLSKEKRKSLRVGTAR